jgi:hypothetical protein
MVTLRGTPWATASCTGTALSLGDQVFFVGKGTGTVTRASSWPKVVTFPDGSAYQIGMMTERALLARTYQP